MARGSSPAIYGYSVTNALLFASLTIPSMFDNASAEDISTRKRAGEPGIASIAFTMALLSSLATAANSTSVYFLLSSPIIASSAPTTPIITSGASSAMAAGTTTFLSSASAFVRSAASRPASTPRLKSSASVSSASGNASWYSSWLTPSTNSPRAVSASTLSSIS